VLLFLARAVINVFEHKCVSIYKYFSNIYILEFIIGCILSITSIKYNQTMSKPSITFGSIFYGNQYIFMYLLCVSERIFVSLFFPTNFRSAKCILLSIGQPDAD